MLEFISEVTPLQNIKHETQQETQHLKARLNPQA